jgi:hypothetical protein
MLIIRMENGKQSLQLVHKKVPSGPNSTSIYVKTLSKMEILKNFLDQTKGMYKN